MLPMRADIQLELADWAARRVAIAPIRTAVFIQEQGVTEALEWDGLDETALHVLAYSHDLTPIGTARLLDNGHVGRMSVLPAWRNQGVGSAMLALLLQEAARRGYPQVKLAAQEHAVAFYERQGFTAYGEIFMDAGIRHRWMSKTLRGGE